MKQQHKDIEVIRDIVETLAPKTETPYKGVHAGEHLVQVCREEYGKIVGNNGMTISSLNALAHYMGRNGGAASQIVLLPPLDDGPVVRVPYIPGTGYDKVKVSRILNAILGACGIHGKIATGDKSVAVFFKKDDAVPEAFEKAFVTVAKALTRFTGYPARITVVHE